MGIIATSVIILLTIFTTALAGEAEIDDRNCEDIYVTDQPEKLSQTITQRERYFASDLRGKWRDANAEFTTTKNGEEILTILGLEVMRGFEKPYMTKIAEAAVSRGGKVLNIGYGIGYIDTEIERLGASSEIVEHHIIELNRDVAKRARIWREKQINRDRIFIHEGDWKQVLGDLVARDIQFDGIAYDAFPLEKQELHRDFIPFLQEAIRLKAIKETTGVITFYMDSQDGFGEKFKDFAHQLGVGQLSAEKVGVQLPDGGNQYWQSDFFYTPTLSKISYGTER